MMFESRKCEAAEPDWAAFIAIDGADAKHDWAMEVPGQKKRERGQIAHTPEAIDAWVNQLRQRFGDRPMAICLEQTRGALLFSLSKYGQFVLYPLHPATASHFRKTIYPSGSKNDPLDADVQLDLLVKHRERLQVWNPDTEQTRLLQFLVEDRRRQVNHKTALLNQLTNRLKLYFPQIPSWFGSADSMLVWRCLEQWPELKALQKVARRRLKVFLTKDGRSCPADVDQVIEQIRQAIPATEDRAVVESGTLFVQDVIGQLRLLLKAIQQYDERIEALVEQHPDFSIVSSFPGAGKALAPRLIAALGTQRDRFPDAGSIQSYSGLRRFAKPAANANGSIPAGLVRSSSNRPFKSGRNTRCLAVLGRVRIMRHNEHAARDIGRRFEALRLNGSAFCSDAGKTARPTTISAIPTAFRRVTRRPITAWKSCGKKLPVSLNRSPFPLDLPTQMSHGSESGLVR